MAMNCEEIDAFPSKKIEMSKGKPEVIIKESKVLNCLWYY